MDKDYFKKKLEDEKVNLEKQIEHYENSDPYRDQVAADTYDEQITEIEEHDRISATQEELKRRLFDVEKALKRIEDGSYGKCINCGNEISIERLEIMPAASFCSSCQEKRKSA